LIRKIKPNLIHAHQLGAHALYAWFSGVTPLVISAWGSDVLVKPRQSALIRGLVKFLISRAALITSDSAQVSAELMAYGAKPKQILTFLFGIDHLLYEKLAHAPKHQEHLIICSPRLHEPLYNIKTIIMAFQQVRRTLPEIELWVLGDGSLTAELQQYVSDSRLAVGIRFWGRVTPRDFSERLAESDLIVSIPTSDGTPVSMLEGMAAGCLPILSDLPVYHDWVDDGVNGLIVKPDFSNLTTALQRGIADESLRQQAAVINRKLIKERAIWEEQFQPMLEYYKAKIGGG
jgi:glycosyltransferase involved in cell wall biosynthesis